MTSSGFSADRLARLHETMTGHVEQGELPGLVTMVSRHGETHVDAIGSQAMDGATPMAQDTIFRITSMTKPVTAVAAMILVEEGRLRLDDPVDQFLPELSNRRVLRRPDAELDDAVPAERPITLRDLLTFRLGSGVVMAPPGTHPIQTAIDDLQIFNGPPMPATPLEPDEWMRRLGSLPLIHQPGTQWMYTTGSHVLGVLIARVAGKPLSVFLQERILAPLGMVDTAFHVPADKLIRLATCYRPSPTDGALEVQDGVQDSQWSQPPAFFDGAAGLVSTANDYLAFGQMLLDKGSYGNERILSRVSVDQMTRDQLTPDQKSDFAFIAGSAETRGWGFGMSVVTTQDQISATPGQFGWDGGFGTSWRSDPAKELVGILMTQRLVYPIETGIDQDFWTGVYAALTD